MSVVESELICEKNVEQKLCVTMWTPSLFSSRPFKTTPDYPRLQIILLVQLDAINGHLEVCSGRQALAHKTNNSNTNFGQVVYSLPSVPTDPTVIVFTSPGCSFS